MDEKQKELRRYLLELAYEKGVSHIGPSMSCLDIIHEVYDKYYDDLPDFKFILSKGHAVMALYVVLYDLGVLDEHHWEDIFTAGSSFIGHVPYMPELGIDHATGSLGHGLPVACGMALASPHKTVVCVMGDGETNEGSVWEAIAFANRYNKSNLKIIVDCNGTQGIDSVENVFDADGYKSIKRKIEAFGLTVNVCEDASELSDAIDAYVGDKPPVFLVKTIKSLEDHYKKLDEKTYKEMLRLIDES